MMSTIRDTATTLLQQRGMGSYVSQAEPIIEGLEARDAVIVERLTDYAVGMGVDESEVDQLLVEVGLRAPRVRSCRSPTVASPVPTPTTRPRRGLRGSSTGSTR